MRGKRSKLKDKKIQNEEGIWMEEQAEITGAATKFFQKQYTKQKDEKDFSMLDKFLSVVSVAQNE